MYMLVFFKRKLINFYTELDISEVAILFQIVSSHISQIFAHIYICICTHVYIYVSIYT
jgi:hypothetical protein